MLIRIYVPYTLSGPTTYPTKQLLKILLPTSFKMISCTKSRIEGKMLLLHPQYPFKELSWDVTTFPLSSHFSSWFTVDNALTPKIRNPKYNVTSNIGKRLMCHLASQKVCFKTMKDCFLVDPGIGQMTISKLWHRFDESSDTTTTRTSCSGCGSSVAIRNFQLVSSKCEGCFPSASFRRRWWTPYLPPRGFRQS